MLEREDFTWLGKGTEDENSDYMNYVCSSKADYINEVAAHQLLQIYFSPDPVPHYSLRNIDGSGDSYGDLIFEPDSRNWCVHWKDKTIETNVLITMSELFLEARVINEEYIYG